MDATAVASRQLRQQQGTCIGKTHQPQGPRARLPAGLQQPGTAPATGHRHHSVDAGIGPGPLQQLESLAVTGRKPAPTARRGRRDFQAPAGGGKALLQPQPLRRAVLPPSARGDRQHAAAWP